MLDLRCGSVATSAPSRQCTRGADAGGRPVRRTFSVLLLLMAILSTAAPASADIYLWFNRAAGNWNDPANWSLVGMGRPNSFPQFPGDIAIIANPNELNVTITIPANVTITLGQLQLTGLGNVSIGAPTGTTGRLVFDRVAPSPEITVRDEVSCNINVPVQLNQSIVATVDDRSALLLFKSVSENGPGRAFTKQGAGVMRLEAPSSFTGPTTIKAGDLELGGDHIATIAGDLVVGDLAAGTPAQLLHNCAECIADTAKIDVHRGGVLLIAGLETLGDVRLTEGAVLELFSPQQDVPFKVSTLTMTGGTVRTREIDKIRTLALGGTLTATSGPTGEIPTLTGNVLLDLQGATRTFSVLRGPGAADLDIAARIVDTVAATGTGVTKTGAGTLRFTGALANTYKGRTAVNDGRLELRRTSVSVPGELLIDGGEVQVLAPESIDDAATVTVPAAGRFTVSGVLETIRILSVNGGTARLSGPGNADLRPRLLAMTGGTLEIGAPGSVVRLSNGSAAGFFATSSAAQAAVIRGEGRVLLGAAQDISVDDGPQAIDLRIDAAIADGAGSGLRKIGAGTALLTANNSYTGTTNVDNGTLLIAGTQPTSAITLTDAAGATLGGTGTVGPLAGPDGTIAPGLSPGILRSGNATFTTGVTLSIELNGPTPGTDYDQLRVTGSVNLANATLAIASSTAPPGSRFTIVDNDGTEAIAGTFKNLPEGATLTVGGVPLHISYTGGDGNDVVLADSAPISYYLAEGATGEFFDDDVLIANPNEKDAPITLTFLQEGGGTIVEQRTVTANARLTVHVDQIPGLEQTSASLKATSENGLPLVVERSMFWDASYYGGHTANAVAQPDTHWIFAEGFQGFFDTYLLIANANATATTATVTFLRENDTPVVKAFPIAPFARKTIFAGDIPEIVDHAFGMVVDATLPVIAERSMYFASLPGHLWSGGHVNTGVNQPSTSWFHAEGATGTFFNTFILLSNPQMSDAHVDLRFLLEDGTSIVKTKTLPAGQRLTVNPATEGEPRLENASVSTIVTSDVAIVSERSMYWPGDAVPLGEGHNSSGVVSPGTRWGLAEGRVGGPHHFTTYILLANPSSTEAHVTVTYLRENGAAVRKTYIVAPTSRFNIDAATVTELQDESFGARIEVTNGVDIAVERSLYWDANGIFFAGGSNALATRLP